MNLVGNRLGHESMKSLGLFPTKQFISFNLSMASDLNRREPDYSWRGHKDCPVLDA